MEGTTPPKLSGFFCADMGKLIVKNRYGVVPNEVLNNQSLSFKAKGLYAYIQSKPDDWAFSSERIADQTKEGRDGIRAGLKELEDALLLERIPIQDSISGKIVQYEYILHDKPHTEEVPNSPKADDGKAVNGSPVIGKAVPFSNKEYSKKDISKKETEKAVLEKIDEEIQDTSPPVPNTILSEMTNYWLKVNPNYKKIQMPENDTPAIRKICATITKSQMFHTKPELAMKKWRAFCNVVLVNPFYLNKPLRTIANNIQTFLEDIEKSENGLFVPPQSKTTTATVNLPPQKINMDGKKGYYINNGAPIKL